MNRSKDPSGEQVFSGDVDGVLTEKIIKRTRLNKRNLGATSPESDAAGQQTKREIRPVRGQGRKLLAWAVVLLSLAMVSALAIFGWRRSRS